MKILLTGASGFVGQQLIKNFQDKYSVLTLKRNQTDDWLASDNIPIDYQDADVLVHLAGLAHVTHEADDDLSKEYYLVNVDYTVKIATLARKLNIRRIVFLSSIKVNGEVSSLPYQELTYPAPIDLYGKTKWLAETKLQDFCYHNEIDYVVIRPPLIYGARVKANFKNLINLCKKPVPLPFGAIKNKRSLVYLENLIDFIEVCCSHPKAANQIFLISDGYDVSTTQLIQGIKKAFNKPSLLLPVPQQLLEYILNALGKTRLATRLCGNLQLDITKAKTLLDWQPPYTFEQGIKKTADAYQQND